MQHPIASVLALAASIVGVVAPSMAQDRPKVATISETPVIDGRLDEPVWEQATDLGLFTEVEPIEGDPADPPTRVLIMRDRASLYVGVICMEPDPESMVLQNMRRDAFLNDDDRIEFVLDTFLDRRSAYFFQMSAAGSRGDALINDNGRRFNKRWDAFWEGRTQIEADRWVAEIRIPFRSIAFGPNGVWGFNLERFQGSTRTRFRWRATLRQFSLFNIREAGAIEGFTGLDQGLGLEFLPYAKVKAGRSEPSNDNDVLGAMGGEFNWRITPQLTGSLTINTDFAETEVDDRRVNLTRFPLFFPEKRDFFLEDSALFEFGEQGRGGRNVLPFFSRRIGLSDGNEVPIDVGARLAGRIDNVDLGMLAVRTSAVDSASIPEGEIFVARPSVRVNDEISVGGLFTSGNPASDDGNVVTGADFRYTSADLLPGTFNLNVYGIRSTDDASGEVGGGYGMQSSLRTRDWEFALETLATQGSFRPALGFVRRPGERRYRGFIQWRPRPDDSDVRLYSFAIEPNLWTDLSGEVQTYELDLRVFGIEWHNGDEFEIELEIEGDRLERAFSPVMNSTIPAGEYDWENIGIQFQASDVRPLSGRIRIEIGSWYSGSIARLRSSLNWRPSAALELGVEYREDRANLPGGDFATRVEAVRLNLNFGPDLSLENLIQADNQSDSLGWQSRLRFIQQDGRELFVVLNTGWEELPGGTIVPLARDITLKLVYALRF